MHVTRPLLLLTLAISLVNSATTFYGQEATLTSPDAGPTQTFDALAKAAGEERQAGQSAAAVEAYARAVALRPTWAEGWWYLGTLQYEAGQYAPAIASFEKLLQLTPQSGIAWSFLGLCDFETKDYAQSLAHLERGASLGTSDDPEIGRVAAYHLAMLLLKRSRFDQATKTIADAFGSDPYPQQAKLVLGLALLRAPLLPQELDPSQDALCERAGEAATLLARGDNAKSIEALRALLSVYPSVPYLNLALGVALASSGHLDEALVQLRAERKKSPQSELPLIELSKVQQRLHHPEDAVHSAMQAVALANRSAVEDRGPAHQALAAALRSAGRESAAEARLAQSSSSDETAPEPRMITLYATHSAVASPQASASEDFEAVSHAALEAQTAGQLDEAIKDYKHALLLHPDWDKGLWSLGMLSYSSGDLRDAIPTLTTYLARNAGDGTAWAVLGLCEFNQRDYDNALIHLERGEALKLQGTTESVQNASYHLGILRSRASRFEDATAVLATAASRSGPLDREVEFAMGMAQLRMPLLPAQVPPSSQALVKSVGAAAELLQHQRYEPAFASFQQLLKQYPRTAFLHYAYGIALASLSKYDEAADQMRQELLISPTSEWPNIRLAWIELRRHRASEAIGPARRAVALAPDSAQTHYLLGRAYLESSAIENGSPQGIAVQSESPVRGALDLASLNIAIEELQKANKITPGSPEIHFTLGKAYAKARQPEKAEAERAEFTRLNALSQQQQKPGNDAYQGPRDLGEMSTH